MSRNALKRAVNGALAHFGLRLVKLSAGIGYDSRFGADLLTAFVSTLASRTTRPLRLVQIGANDGITNDPVAGLLKSRLVEAVLVEPIPALCASLTARYADRPDVRVVQAAVAPQRGALPLYIPVTALGEPVEDSVSSLDRSFVERLVADSLRAGDGLFPPGTGVDAVEVDVITLADVLERAGWAEADVIVVDAEGLDAEIVGHILDEGYRPELILFEAAHIRRCDFGAFVLRLETAGYRFARSGLDILAVHSGAEAACDAVQPAQAAE